MAGQGIHTQKDYVAQQDQGADSYSDSSVKKESTERVTPKKDEEDEPYIQKIAMEILQNKRKRSLAPITVLPAFADAARGWIEKKGAVVSLPIVIAGDPESQRPDQNQQRRRERPPPMMGVNERRIKRRKIRPPFVIVPFEGPQSGINSEPTEQNNDGH
jgi:hypothetical protein